MSFIELVHADWIPEHIDKNTSIKTLLFDLLGHCSAVAQTSSAPNINERPRHDPRGSGHRSCSGRKKTQETLAAFRHSEHVVRHPLSVTSDRDGQAGRFAVSLFSKNQENALEIFEMTIYISLQQGGSPSNPQAFPSLALSLLGQALHQIVSSSATAQRPVHLSLGPHKHFLNEVHGCGAPAWWTSTMISFFWSPGA